MTHLDVTSLAGDPGCTQSEQEWADDMLRRLYSVSDRIAARIWNEMTDDELATMVAACRKRDLAA